MKINESELKQIIKEETLRLKKLINLKNEKAQIKKQLTECEGFNEESLTEDESTEVANLLSQELNNAEQKSQPEVAQQQNAPTMEEAFLGKIGEKIKGAAQQATSYAQKIVDQQFQAMSPEQIQTLKQAFAPFQGKNTTQLMGLVKGKLEESVITEGMDMSEIKDKIGSVLKAIGVGAGIIGIVAELTGIVAMQIIQWFPTVSPIFYGGLIALAAALIIYNIGVKLSKY